LLINTAYQSSLISVLTHPQFEPPVDTVEKLLDSQMPYGYITPVKVWYKEAEDPSLKTILQNGIECSSLEYCLKRIISNQDFAVCGGGLNILYLSHQKKYLLSGVPKFIPFKDEVGSYFATMFFRSGSPLLESFNRIIYPLVESGIVHKFCEDVKLQYIGQKDDADENQYEDDKGGEIDAVVLTVRHLEGVFILLLLGLGCGVIVFLIELLCLSCTKYQFRPLLNTSVREFKSRSCVKYKNHVIYKTLVRHVKKSNLTGKVKKSP